MNRSLLLTLCLASATCLGTDNCFTATSRQLKDVARATSATVWNTTKKIGQATAVKLSKATALTKEALKKAGHSVWATCQTAKTQVQQTYKAVITSERARAAQALLQVKCEAVRTYVKANPGKTALMAVGAGTAIYIAYRTIKAAWNVATHYPRKHNA